MLSILFLTYFGISKADYLFCVDRTSTWHYFTNTVSYNADSRITCAAMAADLGRPKVFSYNKSSEMCEFPQYNESAYEVWRIVPYTDIPKVSVGIPSPWCRKGIFLI